MELSSLRKHKKGLVYLIRGSENNQPTWYYIEIKDNVKLALLNKKSAIAADNVPLNEYGKVIESGWGKNPPPEVVKNIEEQYN